MTQKKRRKPVKSTQGNGCYRLSSEVLTAVKLEAAKRNVWPNRVVEECLRNHFRLSQPA
jgi:hypothetical protein